MGWFMSYDTKINELLGARKFQKCVFALEKLKYKMIEKFFPNMQTKYEKSLYDELEKKLSKDITEEEKNVLIKKYQMNILLSRSENNNKQNRNYHVNKDNPMDFIKYLKQNKKIHVRSIIKNGIIYIILIPLVVFSNISKTITIPLLLINTISTLINFECINLQNYNIKRFEQNKVKLDSIRKKREEKDLERYKEISKIISDKLNENKEIPKVEEIVDRITTKEQLQEMRKLLSAYSEPQEIITQNKGGRKCLHL